MGSSLEDDRWLRRRYIEERSTAAEIAAELGTHPDAVLRQLHAIGITPARGARVDARLHDAEQMRRIAAQSRNLSEIAEALGCSTKSAGRWLARHGIDPPGKPHSNAYLENPKWLRRRYVNQRTPLRVLAQEVGMSRESVRQALKRHGIDRRPRGEKTRPWGSASEQTK